MSVIVFDAVGTLIRPRRSVSQTYFQFGQRFGSQLDLPEIQTRFRFQFQRLFRGGSATNELQEKQNWLKLVANVFTDLVDTRELFEDLWEYFAQPENWQLFDDVESNWNRIRQNASGIAVASNFDNRLRGILDALLPLSANQVFLSSEIGWPKPAPAFFDRIESAFADQRQFVMVGDDPVCDIQPALDRGWHAIWIDRQSSASHAGELVTIRSLAELEIADPVPRSD